MTTKLFTVGYEGRSADEVIDILRSAGVSRLLDVRYRPQSRKKGLSKTSLGERCAEVDIEYAHDRDLGTPPEHMKQVKAQGGYDDEAFEEYREYLREKGEALAQAAEMIEGAPTCLLCYEADASDCHRSIVAEELAERTGFTIDHL